MAITATQIKLQPRLSNALAKYHFQAQPHLPCLLFARYVSPNHKTGSGVDVMIF